MIIKSMSRKSRTFSQLYHYMKNGSSRSSQYDYFSHNLYTKDEREVVKEFLKNSHLLRGRTNGNYLFHEVISITKSSQLTLQEEKQRLLDVIRHYVTQRCNNNLVVGFLHDEKANNVHYHLMISSNELGARKNQRITKFDFNKVMHETERYVIAKYPELEQEIIIGRKKSKDRSQLSKAEWELKRKGGRAERKQNMIDTLTEVFQSARTAQDFFRLLASENIELYNRGNATGFINQQDGKRYRLKTLELEEEFKPVRAMLASQAHKEQKSEACSDKEPEQQKANTSKKSRQKAPEGKEAGRAHSQTESDQTSAESSSESEIRRRKSELEKARSKSQSKIKNRNR